MTKKPDDECAEISLADVLAALRRASINAKLLAEFHGTPYVVREVVDGMLKQDID